jgi:hypothetical protein
MKISLDPNIIRENYLGRKYDPAAHWPYLNEYHKKHSEEAMEENSNRPPVSAKEAYGPIVGPPITDPNSELCASGCQI